MKYCKKILFFILLILNASAYAVEITPPGEIKRRIDSGALIIDARPPSEYARGHILDAINIPLDSVDAQMWKIGKDHKRFIIVYCKSGKTAEKLRIKLVNRRYARVYNAGAFEDLDHFLRQRSHALH